MRLISYRENGLQPISCSVQAVIGTQADVIRIPSAGHVAEMDAPNLLADAAEGGTRAHG